MMRSNKKSLSKLIKELEDCKNELKKVSIKYNNSKSILTSHPLSTQSSKSIITSHPLSTQSKESELKKRPVGRPPLKCEQIKDKTHRITKEFIDKKTKERCKNRENHKYKGYKCNYIDGKCIS